MSLTFYFAPMSTASITDAVLAELDIPCERVELNIRAGGTKTPEFLKINPNGKVPTIVHDGIPIWESCAITMYLGEVFGVEKKLYPAPGPKRGEAMRWIAWGNVTLAQAAIQLPASNPSGHAGVDDPSSKASVHPGETSARAALTNHFRILDNALEGKSALLGDYSLADTHLQSIVGWISMMGLDLKPFPNVERWFKV
jgi:glutathione S-transferase